MPMHNWARVKSGVYHNFHFRWIAAIMDRLNAGLLPAGYFAMAEQIIGQPETDVVALETFADATPRRSGEGSVATVPLRSQTRFVVQYPPERSATLGSRTAWSCGTNWEESWPSWKWCRPETRTASTHCGRLSTSASIYSINR